MDLDIVALKIQRAIGQQVILISILLVVGVLASIWLVNLAAKPLGGLLAYAVELSDDRKEEKSSHDELLDRDDEVGDLARLFRHVSGQSSGSEGSGAPQGSAR